MKSSPIFLPILALAVAAGSTARGADVPSKPNVIVILTDDQGFGDLGATGNPVIHTPNIDRLAGQSVSLTNFQLIRNQTGNQECGCLIYRIYLQPARSLVIR